MNFKKNKYQSEATLKYFIVQRVSSILILIRIFSINIFYNLSRAVLILRLLLKTGVAPFHQWIPAIVEGLDWNVVILLLIPQKVGPLILIRQLMQDFILKNKIFIFIVLTSLIGSIGGLINYSLRKILVYSSISHSGWMLARLFISVKLWLSYFFIYSIILFCIISQFKQTKISNLKQIFLIENIFNKYRVIIIFLSLRGLPPFRGFLAKYLIILSSLRETWSLIMVPVILRTLIRLFFYLRVVLINSLTEKRKSYKRINKVFISNSFFFINLVGLTSGWFLFLFLDFKLKKLKDFKSLNKIILKSR